MSFRLNTKKGRAWRDVYLRGVTIRRQDRRNGTRLLLNVAEGLSRQVEELEKYQATLQLRYDLVLGLCVASRLALGYLQEKVNDEVVKLPKNCSCGIALPCCAHSRVSIYIHGHSKGKLSTNGDGPKSPWLTLQQLHSQACNCSANLQGRVIMQDPQHSLGQPAALALEHQITAALNQAFATQLLGDVSNVWLGECAGVTSAGESPGPKQHGDSEALLSSLLKTKCSTGKALLQPCICGNRRCSHDAVRCMYGCYPLQHQST
jgi:hypothetical protein